MALEALGRRREASARYRQALRLDPSYSLAHNNLGNLLAAEGHLDEAMTSCRAALGVDPSSAAAYCSLAQALLVTGQPRVAVVEFERALALKPDWPACATSYVWALSTYRDLTIRDASRAIALGERLVQLTRRSDPAVLDALAAAYAAAGRFDDAVRVVGEALQLNAGAVPALTAAMGDRLSLYRRREPFVIPE